MSLAGLVKLFSVSVNNKLIDKRKGAVNGSHLTVSTQGSPVCCRFKGVVVYLNVRIVPVVKIVAIWKPKLRPLLGCGILLPGSSNGVLRLKRMKSFLLRKRGFRNMMCVLKNNNNKVGWQACG